MPLGLVNQNRFQGQGRPNQRLEPTAPMRRNSEAHFHSWRFGRGRGGSAAGRRAMITASMHGRMSISCRERGDRIVIGDPNERSN